MTKDGKSRIARIDARKVVLGGVEQLLSVVADVTEQNAAAAAIKRFVSALEFIPQGIALWDSEQRLVHHNERYREILEPAGQEMVPGSSLEDLHREIAA